MRKDIFLVAIAALLLILIAVWLMSRIAVVEIPPGNDRFGIAFISTVEHLTDEARYSGALAAGARWNRWPLYWHWVAEGGYVGPHSGGWHDYDELVAQDIGHGLNPVVILMGTPGQYAQVNGAEASTHPQAEEVFLLAEHVAPASMATAPPSQLYEPIFVDGSDNWQPGKAVNPANRWASFVSKTVERYRPGGLLAQQKGWPENIGVRHWEIWNEPDYTSFWVGTVPEYHRLLEVAYKTIKAADPQATVLMGGLAFYDQPSWFRDLLKQIGRPERAYFDALSFHHYLSIYNSEERLVQTRAALDSYGLADVPIWITESGVSVWDDYPASTYNIPANEPVRGTRQEQAAYIIQNSALAFYHGVERYYHFMLHDDCGDGPSSAYGLRQNFTPHLCNPAQGSFRPAYTAYQLATQQFRNLKPLWREKTIEQDQVAFYREDDASRVLVAWATTGVTATATISAAGEIAQLYWIETTAAASQTASLSQSLTLTPTDGLYTLTLPPATNQNSPLPNDLSYQIGGPPYLLVEQDTRPPTAVLTSLPPASPEHILVRWQGQDAGAGTGIDGYDLWVSEDGQPLQPWLTGVTINQSNYVGRIGHSYGFAVRARDRAGNEMAIPTSAQVATQVVEGLAVSGVVLGPDKLPVAKARVAIAGPNSEERLVTNSAGLWGPVSLLAGDYSIEASADGYTTWPSSRRVTISATTSLPLTLAPPVNHISAGDFEGSDVWEAWSWNGQVNRSIVAFDGQFGVRLGDGVGEPMTCPNGQPGQFWAIGQTVTASPEVAPLSFMVKISTTQTSLNGAWFEVSLLGKGQQQEVVVAGDLWQNSDWQLVSTDLSAWRGQTVELQFRVRRCSEQPFSVTVDRVSLGEG
jgi:hypothetical protein